MSSAPIAIVGRGCVLPGATTPERFAERVFAGEDLVRGAPPEGRFGLANAQVLGHGADRAVSLAGGYVDEATLDLTGLRVADDELSRRDPLLQWLCHAGRAALVEAGYAPQDARLLQASAILGNLGFPSESLARYGEDVVLDGVVPSGRRVDARDARSFGAPIAEMAHALGLGGAAFALDAACASALYALQAACDALQSGRTDLVLTGAVQRSDSLFLHIGFTALGAMSPSGRSRPFDAQADGLVPAEGCVVLALRRLDDAQRDRQRVLGVIRGVGTSNDGRARSLLAPSSAGQVRALRAAWADAEVQAGDLQLVECHATGTPTGDLAELTTLATMWGDAPRPAIGSLKSQLGHLITTAGAAGILKVLAGFERACMPPTLHADRPIEATQGFTLLHAAREWRPGRNGRRTAGINAFGFGGNNAHVVIEEAPPPPKGRARTSARPSTTSTPLAIVAVAGRASDAEVRAGEPLTRGPTREVPLALDGLRTPPNDLRLALPQQALVLQAARDTWACVGDADPTRTAVFVGMECDPRITAWGLRWRLATRLGGSATNPPALADRAAPPLRAEHVLGTMPNIPANRVNVQLDAGAAGFTVASEELSGVHALALARDALEAGRIDVALVAAVHVGGDVRHDAIQQQHGAPSQDDDACLCLAVTTLERATSAGLSVLATIVSMQLDTSANGAHDARRGAAEGLAQLVEALATHGQPRRLALHSSLGQRVTVELNVPETLAGSLERRSMSTGLVLQGRPEMDTLTVTMSTAPSLPATTDAPRRPDAAVPPPTQATHTRHVSPGAPATTTALNETSDARPDGLRAALVIALLRQRAAVASAHSAYLEAMTRAQAAALAALGPLPTASAATNLSAIDAGTPRELHAPVTAPSAAPPAVTASRSVDSRPTPAPAPATVPRETDRIADPSTPRRVGPSLDRGALEDIATGAISRHFGEAFRPQDAHARVVRMPAPPLLLCDRVLGIAGPPLVLGRGSTWTETDVGSPAHRMPGTPEGTPAWYLHDGHMRGGVFIEAGQADLLIASWQGIDVHHNAGERVYRLLGCDLTYRGSLPATGETLRYDIHVDGHARLGEIRMFFFHYDCRVGDAVRLDVRNGQAGFFTEEELATSGGILWDADTAEVELGVLEAPRVSHVPRSLGRVALEDFARRDLRAAFGAGHARACTHTRSPSIPGGDQLLLHRVEVLDPKGGPWERGYLRAALDISPDDAFFRGHFHGDPCMPGTLMFDGCLQAMAVYMAALGFTLEADGWRFEPAKDETFHLRCRGQVVPSSRELIYELFVQETFAGDPSRGIRPRVRAQVLCTVDGLKCFHADPLTVELVPDWPLQPDTCVTALTEPRVLAAALGRPSDAFGPMARVLDDGRAVPRLPGPPYLCVSRILEVTPGAEGSMRAGAEVLTELDLPETAPWRASSTGEAMPWSYLLEAALQPCGWLASHVGCVVHADGPVLFRNLDGEGVVHAEVLAGESLRTRARMTGLNRAGGMTLVTFQVEVTQGDTRVYTLQTGFGFFPPAAFVNQAGVGSTPEQRAVIAATPTTRFAVRGRASHKGLALPPTRLCMLDRVVEFSPDGGAHALGRYRGELDVDPAAWSFRAHFFQDPVQPGSLGLEALVQLVQVAMAEAGIGERRRDPRFAPITSAPHAWRYRGQVRPENTLVQLIVEVTGVDADAEGETWIADGSLWVDGLRIYEARGISTRVVGERIVEVDTSTDVSTHAPPEDVPPTVGSSTASGGTEAPETSHGERVDFAPLPVRAGAQELTHAQVRRDDAHDDADVTLAGGGQGDPTSGTVTVLLPDPTPAGQEWPFGPCDPLDGPTRDALAQRLGCAPDRVVAQGHRAWSVERPLRAVLTDTPGSPRIDDAYVLAWWRTRLGLDDPWHESLVHALLRGFVGDLVLHDVDGLAAIRGRPAILLANHQNYLEGALFTALMSPVMGLPLRAVAKTAHRERWLGMLARLASNYPGARYVERVAWFDPADGASLPGLARRAMDRPLLVHVEGTRQTEPAQRIAQVSSTWMDLALERGLPIVPVAFRGGASGSGTRHEVPPGLQTHHVGSPILPEDLAALPYAERRRVVAEAIDALGVPEALADGDVLQPGPAIARAIQNWSPELAQRAERPPRGALQNWFALLNALTRGVPEQPG